ncbi:M90 family metallopeptidase [Hyphococcus lacteus]|uniref:M90 family metallopeptidase n=1 Tax=Hyphococcus lacteus TaxID=3143536 RepID=A0ABV3Z5R8_9PROT
MSLVIGAGLFIGGRWAYERRRREELLNAPLQPAHKKIVRARVPVYNRLPLDLRKRLDGLINRFIDEVKFHGQEGLEITDDIRVTIAAQACLLIVNKENRWFKSLKTVFVYPAAFKSKLQKVDGHVHSERAAVRTGESWARGPVILAWDHAAYGAFAPHDGENVVIHEFAHQLDEQTGVTDGSPLLDTDQSASQWARVFRQAFAQLRDDLSAGRETFLNPYGATNPAEFFAVATETFFEQPHDLQAYNRDLYDQLSRYYRLDPADWF